MNYAMDAAAGEWQLTDYVRKGIELLDNKKGFFLMTESGKIDWACHANDAAASIHDVLEMSNAVQAAVDFYNAHPNETLILVTADHETGGMAIGYKTTNYDTFLTNLAHQKMSLSLIHICAFHPYPTAVRTPCAGTGSKIKMMVLMPWRAVCGLPAIAFFCKKRDSGTPAGTSAVSNVILLFQMMLPAESFAQMCIRDSP